MSVGALTGFTNIGDVNSHLVAFEKSLEGEKVEDVVADHMLVFMVRGLFSSLQFPYVQFPCTDLSGDHMYAPFWQAVGRLEQCGFRVMALVCDGLAANRRLFRLHDPKARPGDVYKVVNPYCESRQVSGEVRVFEAVAEFLCVSDVNTDSYSYARVILRQLPQ